jgi:GT2 family glycosyltransferase
MKYSFAIGIPTVNRYDLLKEALDHYEKQYPDIQIYIVDNGDQGISERRNINISRPGNNIGVAASWNRLCASIFNNHSHAMILNDDIVMGRTQFDIQRFIEGMGNNVFAVSEKLWSIFLLSRKTYTFVGQFDEKFYPAYFEDNDYRYRMELLGVPITEAKYLNPIVYRNSMTLSRNKSILGTSFNDNRDYYIKKWGGVPGKEKYKVPFTPPDK